MYRVQMLTFASTVERGGLVGHVSEAPYYAKGEVVIRGWPYPVGEVIFLEVSRGV